MQRVRTKLDRLQQEPTQTPSMFVIGIRPKQPIDQQDYHDKDQGRVKGTYEDDLCVHSYPTIKQKILADAYYPDRLMKNMNNLEIMKMTCM